MISVSALTNGAWGTHDTLTLTWFNYINVDHTPDWYILYILYSIIWLPTIHGLREGYSRCTEIWLPRGINIKCF